MSLPISGSYSNVIESRKQIDEIVHNFGEMVEAIAREAYLTDDLWDLTYRKENIKEIVDKMFKKIITKINKVIENGGSVPFSHLINKNIVRKVTLKYKELENTQKTKMYFVAERLSYLGIITSKKYQYNFLSNFLSICSAIPAGEFLPERNFEGFVNFDTDFGVLEPDSSLEEAESLGGIEKVLSEGSSAGMAGICFTYALSKTLKVDESIIIREFNDHFIDDLIKNNYLEETESPKPGDLVVYSENISLIRPHIKHAGIYCGDNFVESKWGSFTVFIHSTYDVPTEYQQFPLEHN